MWHHFVNSRYFSEAAIDFRNNGGKYTLAPRGSKEYFEYWAIQDDRCMNGYSVGGVWIPGRHYFHLNFTPMWKVDDKIALKAYEERRDKSGKVSKRVADRILGFPRFIEMQYEWWKFKHIAWNGGTFMGIHSPGGKHICCTKTRGAGFSYMEAADGVFNYNFIPGSKSYYLAATEQYLTKDGILNKVKDDLDWINTNIPYWKQNRQKKDTLMHQRATYLDSQGEERGSMSEIMGVIVDNPNKTRGKRGKKITFEEAGSFNRLKDAVEICKGSLRDGDFYVGQMTIFGTGGEEGPSIQGLEDIFYAPLEWDMMEFPNIYEGTSDTCGYFVPSFRANFMYHDEDGNCDIEAALESDNAERAKKKDSKDPKALDRRKAEYPQKPSESFQRLNNNGFNIAEVDYTLKKLVSSPAEQALIRHGNLVYSSNPGSLGGVEFLIDSKAKPILDFPHQSSETVSLDGCVTIVERPFRDTSMKVPSGIYQIVFDAYYKDEAQDRTSLFAAYVWKVNNAIDPTYNELPVAWFVGRPKYLKTCHENLFKLANYYNCTVQGEISGGGQAVVDYATAHRLLHKVEFEPEMLHNKEIASKGRNRSYLMNMTTDRKRLGMMYLEDWHTTPRGIDSEGKQILNVHCIKDIPFLKEMRKAGPNVNTDRLSSAIIAMFMLKEKVAITLNSRKERSDFYTRTLFSGGQTIETGTTQMY